jgi:hypothetical protein
MCEMEKELFTSIPVVFASFAKNLPEIIIACINIGTK